MIKLSLKGFADFMNAGAAKQRTILRQYKYPDEDEARAKIIYYREARDRICAYHKACEHPDWFETQAAGLAILAASSGKHARSRLNHNARALLQYREHFAERKYQVLDEVVLRYSVGEVTISVVPDLHVIEDGSEKIIKLEFSKNQPLDRFVKIVSQVMFQSAADAGLDLPSSSVLYMDVPRNKTYKGARAKARLIRDVEATCRNISALWPSI